MGDLKRELERNEAATKMAMAKEHEAQEAKRRAQEAQVMMKAMLQKYEDMKNKLDGAKKDLESTSTRIQHQEEVTEKIQEMKERIEAYAQRKEAVNHLQNHVQLKFDLQNNGLGFLSNAEAETARFKEVQKSEEDKAVRVKAMQEMMKEREKAIEKTDKIKVMLERQLELGDKKVAEQNRIASVREKLLELKMKELELQKAKLARKKKAQEEKERATDDFIAMIDKQLEDMNNSTGTPTQKKEALSAILEKHFNEEEKKEDAAINKESGAIPKESAAVKQKKSHKNKVESPEPAPMKEEQKLITPEPKVDEKAQNPEQSKAKNKKKNRNKNKNNAVEKKEKSPASADVQMSQKLAIKEEDIQPEEESEKADEKTSKDESSLTAVKTADQLKKDIADYISKSKENSIDVLKSPATVEAPIDKKLTEEEVKNMVANIEKKSERVRDDIADMAMSEQYLRTKQALLKAKKKEQEMQIAQRMASLREEEVIKMREKVSKMQELLKSRKTELQITEEIIHEKDGAKAELDKKIEASIRRQSYVEKKIVEKKCDNDNENDEQQS